MQQQQQQKNLIIKKKKKRACFSYIHSISHTESEESISYEFVGGVLEGMCCQKSTPAFL